MKITVHGATGAQGDPVAAALRASGHEVTGISRHPEPGSGIVAANLTDQASLEAAYQNADSVFIHLPIPSGPSDFERWVPAILGALAASNVTRIVFSTSGSSLHEAGPHPIAQGALAGAQQFHAALTDTVEEVVALAPRLFLENLLLPFVAQGVRSDGVLAYPLAVNKPISWISHDHVAVAVVEAFAHDTASGIYDLGLDAVTGPELAAAVGDGIGRAVRYEAISPDEFVRRATPLFGAEMAGGVGGLYEAYATDPTRAVPANAQQLGTDERTTISFWAETAFAG